MDNLNKSDYIKKNYNNLAKEDESLDVIYNSLKKIIERKREEEVNGERSNLSSQYYELVEKQINKYDNYKKRLENNQQGELE